MGWFSKAAKPPRRQKNYGPNPMSKARSGFFSTEVDRLLSGWQTGSSSIDFYLATELQKIRARSRDMVRKNPYGKRYVSSVKSNVVGHSGITVQAQTTFFDRRAGREVLDVAANDAIEAAFKDWALNHADYRGRCTWQDLQHLAISSAVQDGEFIFRIRFTGKYGFQLECIDPELLDVTVNTKTGRGVVRLGVEYDQNGKAISYRIKKADQWGNYGLGDPETVDASEIIHGFINEWPDQSRGIPWMHSALERAKHLEKYEEAALVKARSTAATMSFLRSPEGEEYEGDEDYGNGVTLDEYEAGTIKDIGNREVIHADSSYPHQMYGDFVKAQLQSIASGFGVSYHTLSGDLEGVNYSSIRAGVLEDREIWKLLQNWFIRCLISPVYQGWLTSSLAKKSIKIGVMPLSRPFETYRAAHFQPRRWAWVDPQKDGYANELALRHRLKSYSQIMREQGDDPDAVWREIERDVQMMDQLGIAPKEKDTEQ